MYRGIMKSGEGYLYSEDKEESLVLKTIEGTIEESTAEDKNDIPLFVGDKVEYSDGLGKKIGVTVSEDDTSFDKWLYEYCGELVAEKPIDKSLFAVKEEEVAVKPSISSYFRLDRSMNFNALEISLLISTYGIEVFNEDYTIAEDKITEATYNYFVEDEEYFAEIEMFKIEAELAINNLIDKAKELNLQVKMTVNEVYDKVNLDLMEM